MRQYILAAKDVYSCIFNLTMISKIIVPTGGLRADIDAGPQ